MILLSGLQLPLGERILRPPACFTGHPEACKYDLSLIAMLAFTYKEFAMVMSQRREVYVTPVASFFVINIFIVFF